MNDKFKGYLLGSFAAATYGMNPLFALPLYHEGMDVPSVLFFRYLFALPILAVMIKVRGRDFSLQRGEVFPLICMGLLTALSSLTLFLSYNYMDAGVASTILFVYPIMVALIMFLAFGERLTLLTVVCITLALTGISMLYHTPDGGTLSLTGVTLVLLSSLSYALYIVFVNRPPLRQVPTLKITFYVLLFGLSLFLSLSHFGRDLTMPGKWYLWGNLVGLALFPTAISFLCTTRAIQCIGSTPTAILGALEPVTALVIGISVFGEVLTFDSLCGIVLILVAVILIIAGGNVTQYLVRFRKLFPRMFPHRHRKRA